MWFYIRYCSWKRYRYTSNNCLHSCPLPTFLKKPSFKLLLKSGTDSNDIYNIKNICINFGEQRCRGLLFFHAFTGCDYISSFYGIGKKKWFDTLKEDMTVDTVFYDLSNSPSEVTEYQLKIISQFTLKAYKSPTIDCMTTARLDAVTHQQSETFRSLPPSLGALREHVKRAAFVAGHLWGRANDLNPELPDYSNWGWEFRIDGVMMPVWTIITSDVAYNNLQKTCRCGDKNSCLKTNCSCKETACLPYCKCRAKCSKDNLANQQEIDEDDESDLDDSDTTGLTV